MTSKTTLTAIAAAGMLLGTLPAGHAITWRSGMYSTAQAEAFGRDHGSFLGAGNNGACTGNLVQNNRRILTARHCPAGSQWQIRAHGVVAVSNAVDSSSHDIKVVKLKANSGGTPMGLYSVTDLNGQTFHKAGYGAYGVITSVGGNWFGKPAPLAGHNTYTTGDTPSVQYVLKTSSYSVGTAPGDSGGPGLIKNSSGAWTVSSTTSGPGNGYYIDARVSTARSA